MTHTDARSTTDWQRRLDEIGSQAQSTLDAAHDTAGLEQWRITHLGRKGALADLLSGMASLTPDERKQVGSAANALKRDLESAFSARESRVRAQELSEALAREKIDVTLPGRAPTVGSVHPITRTIDECIAILRNMGFQVTQTPEVESDAYNFDALNMPDWHPARDSHDTLYVRMPDVVLRTHTTAYQARVMSTQQPPVRIVNVGRCYRAEQTDATHEWMFHQIDGLAVDRGLRLSDLRGTLTTFAQNMFGSRTRTRFRCDYFPFVEPGVDLSISCYRCDGADDRCAICHGSGWLEILGAGMVHPRVLTRVGYDPEQVSGFAWGMGVERIAMIKYGIDDIRLFYANDLRFLEQFS